MQLKRHLSAIQVRKIEQETHKHKFLWPEVTKLNGTEVIVNTLDLEITITSLDHALDLILNPDFPTITITSHNTDSTIIEGKEIADKELIEEGMDIQPSTTHQDNKGYIIPKQIRNQDTLVLIAHNL